MCESRYFSGPERQSKASRHGRPFSAAEISAALVESVVPVMKAQARVDCSSWNTDEFFEAADQHDVKRCLEAGADPNARAEEDGYRPLHLAALSNENPKVVQALIAAGADLGARTKDGQMPVHVAASSNRNPKVVQALIAAGADQTPEQILEPLHCTGWPW